MDLLNWTKEILRQEHGYVRKGFEFEILRNWNFETKRFEYSYHIYRLEGGHQKTIEFDIRNVYSTVPLAIRGAKYRIDTLAEKGDK